MLQMSETLHLKVKTKTNNTNPINEEYLTSSVTSKTGLEGKADWLTDWLYSHNQTLHINSDIENYNVQDRKE